MATVEEDDLPPHRQTVGDLLGNVWQEAAEAPRKAVEALYGPKGPHVLPLVLIVALGVSVALALQPLSIVLLVLLAMWVATPR